MDCCIELDSDGYALPLWFVPAKDDDGFVCAGGDNDDDPPMYFLLLLVVDWFEDSVSAAGAPPSCRGNNPPLRLANADDTSGDNFP